MTELERQAYLHAVADLAAATRAERGRIVTRLASTLGVTDRTAWRNLRAFGFRPERAARADKGVSVVSTGDLVQVARMTARARGKRGQVNMPMSEAHRVAVELGSTAGEVSYKQVTRLLNQAGLARRQMSAPEPGISRVSKRPNQVWFFDISVAIQWYFRDESGKRIDLLPDAGARFYAGKVDNFRKIKRVIHRFVLTDHCSGAYYVRYYYTSGERPEDVVDFFYHAMADKPDVAQAYPFRGIPEIMVMDQGPANKSALVTELLKALDVEVQLHKPKNAKASGSVETRHGHWQSSFEGRLAQRFAADLGELNGWAERFCALACAERPHARHGNTPIEAWLTLPAAQLRECPERDIFFELAATHPKIATLTNRLWLRARGREWQIRGEHIYPGQKVAYRLAPFNEAGIRVWDEHDRELSADEITRDAYGFPDEAAHRHVWGDEDAKGSTAPVAPARALVAEVDGERGQRPDEALVPTMFDDLDDRLAELAQKRAYLSHRGQEWERPESGPASAEPRLGPLQALDEVFRRLGRPIGRDGAWWRERIGDGLTRAELDQAWDDFTTLDATAAAGAR